MKVSFGMYYTAYGTVTIDVPDSLQNEEDIKDYVREHWDEVPLPDGEYVPGSDEPDFDNFDIGED